jgi:class 3 adenylate cyclase
MRSTSWLRDTEAMSTPPDLRAGHRLGTLSGRQFVYRTFGRVAALVVGANVTGTIVVGLLLYALNAAATRHQKLLVLGIGGVYGVLAIIAGALVGFAQQRGTLRWLAHETVPTPAEARRALRNPIDLAVLTGALWVLGAAVMAVLAPAVGLGLSQTVGLSGGLVLAGFSTAGVTYLIAARLSQPVAARALAVAPPTQQTILSLRVRLVLYWLLASGVPLFGIVVILAAPPGRTHVRSAALFAAIIAIAVGSFATSMAARSIGAPMRSMVEVLHQVGQGDLDVQVPVDDVGEIGMLQNGLNEMVAGLRERDRIQDLFGRHVGPAVAREAVRSGVALGGEARHVVALFVDITGSTGLTRCTEPNELVAMLNRFFEIVVAEVEGAGGLVNKFEGDGALCVFGAPVELADSATAALRAARCIRDRVRRADEVQVGIGIAIGPVIAGQIGTAARLEYTVIGDAVNEAARLTDLAKRVGGHLLASDAVVAAAAAHEQAHWTRGRTFRLRGRDAPTSTYRSPVVQAVG